MSTRRGTSRPGQPATVSRREFLRRGAMVAGGAAALLSLAQSTPLALAATAAPRVIGAPIASPAASPKAQVKTGGTLVALTVADPKSLDIQVSQLAQLRQISDSIYDTLTYQDASDLGIKPRLAKEWTWTTPTQLDMTLQDGVTFHNGESFTADDVKFNIDRVKNPDTGSPLASMLDAIDTTEVIDPLHVRFTLKQPWPALVENFSNIKIYSKTATDDSIRTAPNGTGPFKFIEWKQNDYIRLEKNPNYWMAGLPYLDALEFRPVKEQETRISIMETKGADVMFSLELKDIPRIESNPDLVVQRSKFNDNGDILYVNNNRPPMNNQNLRLAVSYALDRQTFVTQFLAGYGSRNTSPWDPQHWAYSHEANDNAFPYDLDKARDYLAQAGYPGGKDASGNQLTINIVFPVGYPEWKQGSIMLQSALKQLGVESKVEELELSVWIDRIVNTDEFDLSWDFHGGHVTDPASTLALAFFYPPGPKNICRYHDDQLASLINQGGSTFSQDDRKKIYGDFQKRWNEIQPGYIVGQRLMAHATQAYVKGFVTHPLFYQDLRGVWLDK